MHTAGLCAQKLTLKRASLKPAQFLHHDNMQQSGYTLHTAHSRGRCTAGVGLDFNTEFIEAIGKVKGANYYSVHSPGAQWMRLPAYACLPSCPPACHCLPMPACACAPWPLALPAARLRRLPSLNHRAPSCLWLMPT
jgi:hypothetical protein